MERVAHRGRRGPGSSAASTPGPPASPGARLVAVAGSSPESGRRAADELGAERSFASGEELVEADGIDVVHICTPNHLHEPLALAALAAGKHVVCEKPVALDAAGAARIAEAAGRGRRASSPSPSSTASTPSIREARARVAAGELGRLRLLHGSYQQDWLAQPGRRQLAGRRRAGRRVPGVRRHRLALVRPGRVRGRLPHRPAAGPHRHRRPRAGRGGRHHLQRRPRPTARAGRSTPRTSRSCCSRPTRAALGSLLVSQVSPGRKNRLWFELDGERRRRRVRPGAGREPVAGAPRPGRDHAPRPRPPGARRRPAGDPARRPRPGLPRLLRPVRGRRLRGHRGRGAGRPARSSATGCAPPASPTPCSPPPATAAWIEVTP